jgi:glycine oxidase
MAQPQDNGKGFDVVVVGAGIVGLACAWSVARRGGSVAVLDRASPAAGATRVAAGMLAPVGELQYGEEQLLRMTSQGAAMYAEWVERLEAETGAEAGYVAHGALHVALDRDEAEELRRRHRLQQELGLEARWLGPSACRRVEPGLHPSLAALERRGAEVRSGAEVDGLLADGARVEGVRLGDGTCLRAPAVVCATGCWAGAGEWLPAELRPPVRPVKGEVVELEARGPEPLCGGIVGSERVYVVPRPNGRVIVGATSEDVGFDEEVTAGGVLELLREAYRLLPDVAELRMVEAVAGLRPATPDNVPVVGWSELAGLAYATGHYRNGILLAPLTGEGIADLLEGRAMDGALAGASPERLRVPAAGGGG